MTLQQIARSRWSYAAIAVMFLIATLFGGAPSISPDGVGFHIDTAEASGKQCANGGIDRTPITGATDWWNWQTGIGQDCFVPRGIPNPAGHCHVIDSIHLEISQRLADLKGIKVGQDRVIPGENLPVRLKGPVFFVIDVAYDVGEVYIFEGQVVEPKPEFFKQRVGQRLQVDKEQAARTMVIQMDGSFAPATEDRFVTIFGAKINVGLCMDP